VAQTGEVPSANIFLPSQPAARQTATVVGTVILPLQYLTQVVLQLVLQLVLLQHLHLRLHLHRPSSALATIDLTVNVVPSLAELSVTQTLNIGVALSMGFAEAPRSTATATRA